MECNSVNQACIVLTADGEPALDDGNFLFILPGEFQAVYLLVTWYCIVQCAYMSTTRLPYVNCWVG